MTEEGTGIEPVDRIDKLLAMANAAEEAAKTGPAQEAWYEYQMAAVGSVDALRELRDLVLKLKAERDEACLETVKVAGEKHLIGTQRDRYAEALRAIKSLAECGLADKASERKRHLEDIRDEAHDALETEGRDG